MVHATYSYTCDCQKVNLATERKMIRVTFVIISLIFVQLVNGQDACETAASAVDSSCLVSLNNADPSVCSGTCDAQFSALVAACASSVSLIIASYVDIN